MMNTKHQKLLVKNILYAHDDFYFCPDGMLFLLKKAKKLKKIGHNNFIYQE
jgi:hypothetical protein